MFDRSLYNKGQLVVIDKGLDPSMPEFGDVSDIDPSVDHYRLLKLSMGRGTDTLNGNIDDLIGVDALSMTIYSLGRGDDPTYGNIDDLVGRGMDYRLLTAISIFRGEGNEFKVYPLSDYSVAQLALLKATNAIRRDKVNVRVPILNDLDPKLNSDAVMEIIFYLRRLGTDKNLIDKMINKNISIEIATLIARSLTSPEFGSEAGGLTDMLLRYGAAVNYNECDIDQRYRLWCLINGTRPDISMSVGVFNDIPSNLDEMDILEASIRKTTGWKHNYHDYDDAQLEVVLKGLDNSFPEWGDVLRLDPCVHSANNMVIFAKHLGSLREPLRLKYLDTNIDRTGECYCIALAGFPGCCYGYDKDQVRVLRYVLETRPIAPTIISDLNPALYTAEDMKKIADIRSKGTLDTDEPVDLKLYSQAFKI